MTNQKDTEKKNIFKSYKITILLGIINIVVIAILLSFMTHTSSQNSNVANYTKQISEMNIQNQVLQNQIAQSQSVDTVNNKAKGLGLQQVGNIVYLNNSNTIAENIH